MARRRPILVDGQGEAPISYHGAMLYFPAIVRAYELVDEAAAELVADRRVLGGLGLGDSDEVRFCCCAVAVNSNRRLAKQVIHRGVDFTYAGGHQAGKFRTGSLELAMIVPAVLGIDAGHSRLVGPVAALAVVAQGFADVVVIDHFLKFRFHALPFPIRRPQEPPHSVWDATACISLRQGRSARDTI
jgi:hypothetical protein